MVEAADKRRRDREDFEWKLSLAFWALIVLAIQFLATNPQPFDSLLARGLAALVAMGLYGVFSWGVYKAHQMDGKRSSTYRAQAAALLSESSQVDEGDPRNWIQRQWGLIFQVGTAACLLGIFTLLADPPSPLHWGK